MEVDADESMIKRLTESVGSIPWVLFMKENRADIIVIMPYERNKSNPNDM